MSMMFSAQAATDPTSSSEQQTQLLDDSIHDITGQFTYTCIRLNKTCLCLVQSSNNSFLYQGYLCSSQTITKEYLDSCNVKKKSKYRLQGNMLGNNIISSISLLNLIFYQMLQATYLLLG